VNEVYDLMRIRNLAQDLDLSSELITLHPLSRLILLVSSRRADYKEDDLQMKPPQSLPVRHAIDNE